MELKKLKELANELDDLTALMRSGIALYLDERGDIVLSEEEFEQMMDEGNDIRVIMEDGDEDRHMITIRGVKLVKSSSFGYDITVVTEDYEELDGYSVEVYYWIIRFFSVVENMRNN